MSAPAGPGPESHPAGDAWHQMFHGRRRWIAALLAVALVATAVVVIFNLNRAGTEAEPAAGPTATATPTPSATPSATPTKTKPPAPAPIPELPAKPMNVLVIGSDSRGNARKEAAHTAATGEASDQRADTLMVVHVPADRRSLTLISINRDTWVDVPGIGGAKINASLERGGIDLAKRTVEGLLGIRIAHTLMMDFHGFRVLTDRLGGIDVNVATPFQSTHETRHVFKAGVNHLNGQAALEFARERYAFADGDFQRVRNQQTLLRAILARLTARGALNNVTAVRALVETASCCLTVDKGFNPAQAAILAYSLRNLNVKAIRSMTLPNAGMGYVAGQSVIFPDQAGIAAVGAALRSGRVAQLAR